MIKLLFKLPNNILLKYIEDNFENLSEKDFFQIVLHGIKIPKELYKKNKHFLNNRNILMWVVLNDPDCAFLFEQALFDDDVLDILAQTDITLKEELIEQYPIFLTNQNMVARIIKEFPHYLKKLDKEQVTDKIIQKLVLNKHVLDEDEINKFPFLLNNQTLCKMALNNNPELIFKVSEISKEQISFMKKHNIVPTKEDYFNHPELISDNELVMSSFRKDVSCIIFMKEPLLDFVICQEARRREFVAKEQDLLYNPDLCKYRPIMEPAIMNDPKVIVYTGFTCSLSNECVKYALSNFEITNEILEEHPDLCRNYDIMHSLPEQFQIYSGYKDEEEKIGYIVDCLQKGDINGLKKLPFLRKKFWSKTDIEDKINLINLLYIQFDNLKIESERQNLSFLHQLIHGVCNLRYREQKDKFEFGDIVSLHDYIVGAFTKVENKSNLIFIVDKLLKFINYSMPEEILKNNLFGLYNLFLSRHKTLLLADTNKLCNDILNYHRNTFFSQENIKIINQLKRGLDLNPKKKELIYNGRKMRKIAKLIQEKDFGTLRITKERLDFFVSDVSNKLRENKKLKREGIILTNNDLKYFEKQFMTNGTLMLSDIPPHISKDIAKYICDKYEKIKRLFFNVVTLEEEEKKVLNEKEILAFNCFNFTTLNKNIYYSNLAKLLLTLDEETMKSILLNGNIISEIIPIIPYVGIIKELDLNTLIHILDNYPRAKQRILATNQGYSVTSKLSDLVILCNAYSSVDNIHLFALTDKVVKVLGEENSRSYLEFYLDMLKKKVCYIPPIYIDDNNLIFYSGNYSDQDKLLIGKRYKDSCIDLDNIAGNETFNECLLGLNGDVILVKTKETKEFAGRILLIRRGNIVQLIVKDSDKFSLSLYKKIANEIINQASLVDDNIDYVFVSQKAVKDLDGEIVLNNADFVTKFPHADLYSRVVLLASSKGEVALDEIENDLDFEAEPRYQYSKFRKKISHNPTEIEVSRIRALNILLQEDPIIKEDMSRDFEPFYSEDYDKVICGEEWYIARKRNGELEEIIFPNADIITKQEYYEMRNIILADTLSLNSIKKQV